MAPLADKPRFSVMHLSIGCVLCLGEKDRQRGGFLYDVLRHRGGPVGPADDNVRPACPAAWSQRSYGRAKRVVSSSFCLSFLPT